MKKVIIFIICVIAIPAITFAAGSPEAAAAGSDTVGKGLAALGAGVAAIGAGIGIGIIGGKAQESMARQPDQIADLRSNMIVAAALVEGVAFFAIVVALLVLFV